jgi:uncharacterized protein (DUF1697 family)
MKTYVALLRGINVGGNNIVEMKKLKITFEKLGFSNVITYINSGNIIFESTSNPNSKTIEDAIEIDFSLIIPVLIRSIKNITEVCKTIPLTWTNDTEQKTDILFLWDEIDTPTVVSQIVTNPEVDQLTYVSGALIWHVDRAVYNKSGMHKFVTTKLYKSMTARNINTLRKLVELIK